MARQQKAPPAGVGLRGLVFVVFAGAAASAVAAGHAELLHLITALTHPFHSGTPPSWLTVGGAVGATVGALWLTRQLVRGASVKVPCALIGVCFIASLFTFRYETKARAPAGSNLLMLQQTQKLHEQVNEVTQQAGAVPPVGQGTVWQVPGVSPFRDRLFSALAWKVVRVADEKSVPPTLEPGSILASASPDDVSFALVPVGIDDQGNAVRLTDENHEPLVYRGAFNPDTAR